MDVVRCKRRIRVTPAKYYSRRENDITDILEETIVTEDRFGEHSSQDESNKDAYVDLVVSHRIAGRITEQFRAFMEGLGDVLPLDLFARV